MGGVYDERLYADDSLFNTPVGYRPGGRSVDDNSQAKLAVLKEHSPQINPTTLVNWQIPIYRGTELDPKWQVKPDWGLNKDFTKDALASMPIHIPADVKPQNNDGDQKFWVVDQTLDFVYQISQVRTIDSVNHVITCKRIHRLEAHGSGFRYEDEPPLSAAPIRPDELALGEVNHIFGLNVSCTSGQAVGWYPRSVGQGLKCSNTNSIFNTLSFGDIVYLAVTESWINNLALTIYEKALLRGWRRFGSMVERNTNIARRDWNFDFMNILPYGGRNPYVEAGIPSTWRYGDMLLRVGALDHLRVAKPQPRPA